MQTGLMCVQGLVQLHDQGFAHGDVKPANAMVHCDANSAVHKASLVDLGYSNSFQGMLHSPAAVMASHTLQLGACRCKIAIVKLVDRLAIPGPLSVYISRSEMTCLLLFTLLCISGGI